MITMGIVFKHRSFHFLDMTVACHLPEFVMWHFKVPRNTHWLRKEVIACEVYNGLATFCGSPRNTGAFGLGFRIFSGVLYPAVPVDYPEDVFLVFGNFMSWRRHHVSVVSSRSMSIWHDERIVRERIKVSTMPDRFQGLWRRYTRRRLQRRTEWF